MHDHKSAYTSRSHWWCPHITAGSQGPGKASEADASGRDLLTRSTSARAPQLNMIHTSFSNNDLFQLKSQCQSSLPLAINNLLSFHSWLIKKKATKCGAKDN